MTHPTRSAPWQHMRDLVHTLLPHPALALTLAVLAAGFGVLLTHYAARRTLTRPLVLALDAETTLLAGVLGDLRRYPYLANISGTDFAAGAHARIWEALKAALGESSLVSETASDEDCATLGKALASRSSAILDDLRATLGTGPAPIGDTARLHELLAHPDADLFTATDPDTQSTADTRVVTAGEEVLAGGNDRNRLSGAGLVLPTKTPDSTDPAHPPLERVFAAPTRLRATLTAALSAVAAAVIPAAVFGANLHGAAAVAGTLSMLALLAMSVVVSLVDLDTFYIDMRTWLIGTVASWAAVVVAAVVADDPARLIAGIVMVVLTAVLFEGSNLVFKLVRGMDGQGFGDTLIIVATVGAPAALTGDFRVGYWSVMGGLLAAMLGWFAGRVTGRVNRHTPFAFGPWLAAGWVIALVIYCVDTAFLA